MEHVLLASFHKMQNGRLKWEFMLNVTETNKNINKFMRRKGKKKIIK